MCDREGERKSGQTHTHLSLVFPSIPITGLGRGRSAALGGPYSFSAKLLNTALALLGVCSVCSVCNVCEGMVSMVSACEKERQRDINIYIYMYNIHLP